MLGGMGRGGMGGLRGVGMRRWSVEVVEVVEVRGCVYRSKLWDISFSSFGHIFR